MADKMSYTMINIIHEDVIEASDYACPGCSSGELVPLGRFFNKSAFYSGTEWQCVSCADRYVSIDSSSLITIDDDEILNKGPIRLEFSKEQVAAAMQYENGDE